MTTYEILLMLEPEQAEARQDEIVARTRAISSSWCDSAPSGSSMRRISYVVTVPMTSLRTSSHGLNRLRLPASLGTERRDDGAGSAATVASVA